MVDKFSEFAHKSSRLGMICVGRGPKILKLEFSETKVKIFMRARVFEGWSHDAHVYFHGR